MLVQTETKALYGFSPTRGNGCCTYVKASALTGSWITTQRRLHTETLTYDEYYEMLKEMQAASANQNYRYLLHQVSLLVVTLVRQKLHILTIFQNSIRMLSFTFYYDEGCEGMQGWICSAGAMQEAMDKT